MVDDGVTNLSKKERNPLSATPSSPVLPELSKNLDSPERIVPKYRGPALLVAKEYIRCNWHMIKNNAWEQENSTGEKKSVAEGQTSPNPGNPCKRKRSKRARRVWIGEGFTEEYPAATTFDYKGETVWDEWSHHKSRKRQSASPNTEIIVLDD